MPKQIIYTQSAQEELLGEADALAITLRAKVPNIAIDRGFGEPEVSQEGFTVAKNVALANSFQNMGAHFLKEAIGQTNEIANDGTMTPIVLVEEVVQEEMKNLALIHAVSEHIVEQAIPLNSRGSVSVALIPVDKKQVTKPSTRRYSSPLWVDLGNDDSDDPVANNRKTKRKKKVKS